MAKRAAGFLVYRLVSSDIQYLLLKASYGSHHWTPPKGEQTLLNPVVNLIRKVFFMQVMSTLARMITQQHFGRRRKKPATLNKT